MPRRESHVCGGGVPLGLSRLVPAKYRDLSWAFGLRVVSSGVGVLLHAYFHFTRGAS